MNRLRILSFDPGSTKTGWARVEVMGGMGKPIQVAYQASGNIDNGAMAFQALMHECPTDVVAIEELEAYSFKRTKADGSTKQYGSQMVGHLMKAQGVAREIHTVATLGGLQTFSMTATKVRKMMVGKSNADDATIKRAVLRLVIGWPKTSNSHERDAGLLAVATGWIRGGR